MDVDGSRSVTFGFEELLKFSQGTRSGSHEETIRSLLPGTCEVRQSTGDEERLGIDYVATLRRGAQVFIDVKSRRAGCSAYWIHGVPDFGLEVWSVKEQKITGWTLCEKKQTDLILFIYEAEDCSDCYLVPFQHLRMAFRKHVKEWSTRYKAANQKTITEDGRRWTSSCVFVPAPVVLSAIADICVCR